MIKKEEIEKISIVIPIWNGAKYIQKCLDCLIDQSFDRYRIYIVYDESSDNTLEIIKDYSAKYSSFIRIIYSDERKGLGHARDVAVESGCIQGDYVIFLDADDYAEKEFLEKLYETAIQNKADLVMCGFRSFEDVSGQTITVQMTKNKNPIIDNVESFCEIAFMNPAVWNKLYSISVINKVRFGDLKSMEDAVYLMKALPHIRRIAFVNEILYNYRVSADSLQSNISPTEFKDRWNYYVDLRDYLNTNKSLYMKYERIFELMTFVKCGIGLTYRSAMLDRQNADEYILYSKEMLNKLVPGWRSNKFLQLRHCLFKPFKISAIAGCAFLYKIGMFRMFLDVYSFYVRTTHKEIRW